MQQEKEVFDTVGVTVPVPAGAFFDDGYLRSHLNRETAELGSRLVSSTATVADGLPVKVVNAYGRTLLKFESSVPSCMAKAPLELATADDVREVVHRVLTEAFELLEAKPLDQPRLSRVDVARQFTVPVALADGGIDAIGTALGLSVLRDPTTKGSTAMSPRKETTFRLYDKTAESRLADAEGQRTWRFEVQLRGRATRGAGLDRLDALDAEKALAAVHRVFRRARLGSVIGRSEIDLRAALERAVSEGGKTLEPVIGFAVLRELGITSARHRSTTARYARALATMGLPSILKPSPACFRLDWESGCAVPGFDGRDLADD